MDYEKLKIMSFDHWDLFLHENQFPYVGRCYAWAKKEDAKMTSDMSKAEREELFEKILPLWEKAVKEEFKHDWSNVASFGNTTPHLHWHLVPRYRTSREIDGIVFHDPNPDGNYAPYEKKELDQNFILSIKDKIKKHL